MEEKGEYKGKALKEVQPGDAAPTMEKTVDWAEKLNARRAGLVVEQGKAAQELRATEQHAAEMQALIQRISGAITLLDELLKD